jgi:Gpi18-like mannosyltransferase
LESNESVATIIDWELYSKLNSQDKYSVYPPVSQFVFYLAALGGQNSIMGTTIIIRLFLVATEVLSIVLLPKVLVRYGIDPKNVILYSLNPLVIIEITGNLHFEGAWICFMIFCLLYLSRQKVIYAGFAYALAICSKLIPLLFAPLFIRYLGKAPFLKFTTFTILGCLILFSPLIDGSLMSIFESLDLYFRKFEFNASIYYLVRWIGWQSFGYNIIQTAGPALAKLTIVFIGYFLLLADPKKVPIPEAMMWILTVYLLFSTTVHPWYIAPVVFLSCFTTYRYAIVWSILILFTYLGYSIDGYNEVYLVVGIEYVTVIVIMIRELIHSRYLIELYHKIST